MSRRGFGGLDRRPPDPAVSHARTTQVLALAVLGLVALFEREPLVIAAALAFTLGVCLGVWAARADARHFRVRRYAFRSANRARRRWRERNG